jgi:hypothetical protein
MIAEKSREWLVAPGSEAIEAVLTGFVAHRIMKITERQPGVLEVKGGSVLAAGKRAQVLDWLPVRGRISFTEGDDGHTRVAASIRPRGLTHPRRRLFEELYERKLSSWLADLDRTLRASATDVRDVPVDAN